MNEKRHFKMYKQGKIWVTALAGIGALAMGAMSVDAAEIKSDNAPVVAQQVKIEQEADADAIASEAPEVVEETTVVEPQNEDKAVEEVVTSDETAAPKTEVEIEAPEAEVKTEAPKAKEVAPEAEVKTEAPKAKEFTPKAEVKTEAPKAKEVAPKAEVKTEAPKAKETSEKSEAKAKTQPVNVKNGWEGNKYFKDGKALTGRQTINGKNYLFGSDGQAKTGLQKVGNNIHFYEKNFSQRKNSYVNLGNQGVYYVNGDGNALRGIRRFKDSRGVNHIEVYNMTTRKQLRNTYYTVDNNTKYYLRYDGLALRGTRTFKDSRGVNHLEAYDMKTRKQLRNTYYSANKASKYYLRYDGLALRGTRTFKDSRGVNHLEAYDMKTRKQLRNTYYSTNKTSKYYLRHDGLAIRGIRTFKDSRGVNHLEVYDMKTRKQLRNTYYSVDKNTKYYLRYDGLALRGTRTFKDSKGKQQVEAYSMTNRKQVRNAYFTVNKNTKYYIGNDGRAIRGIRKFKDSKGKNQVEAYHNGTHKQMRNAYYMIDKNTSAYYLGSNGLAMKGIRKFKDSKGNLQIEAYHNGTHKQMRNAYYMIDKNTKKPSAYYLGSNGRAIKGLRHFGKSVEYYGSDFKRVSSTWKTLNNSRYYFDRTGKANQVLLNYKYYSQLQQGAPQGCEGASMQMALAHKGRYVPSLHQIYKKTGSGYNVSPSNGFFGNPFGNGGAVTETIFASALAKSFKNVGAADLTGAKKNDIIRELNRGNAVVTWADYSWRLTGAHSFHVMTIVGYKHGDFLIADPYSYGQRTLWVNQNTWEYVNSNTQTLGYGAPRSMNMAIR